jgi:hypothetical protein
MRFNFRQISALATSALMLGMTAGVASAAAAPAPFVQNGVGDFAVVYGSASPNQVDKTPATNIATWLQGLVSGGGAAGLGSESVKLERSSDKFNLGDNAKNVFVTAITKNNLPTILADGKYRDDSNDEFSYTQKIDLGNNLILTHFRDTDYSTTPTVGIRIPSGTHVLNYTLDFTKDPTFTAAKLETTTLPLLGKEYFVLDVGNNELTLLDSAASTIVAEGETATLRVGSKTYTVTAEVFGSENVKLIINNEATRLLRAGETSRLSDGSYVGVKELVIQNYQGGKKLAEISIGAGKLVLTDGQEVRLNDDSITGLTATVRNQSGVLDRIVLSWSTDDEVFITPEKEAIMPGFGNIKVVMTGFNYPNPEEVKVEGDGTTSVRLVAPIKSGTATFNLLYDSNGDGVIDGIGKDDNNKLATSSATTLFNFSKSAGHKWFVASWNTTTEAVSYLLSATITTSDNANRTSIKDEVAGTTICSNLKDGDSCPIGDYFVLTVNQVYRTVSDQWVTFNISSGGSFNTLYTKNGLKIYLPYNAPNTSESKGAINLTHGPGLTGHNGTSWYLFFDEEDKDGNIGSGKSFNVTIAANSNKELEAQTVNTGVDGTSGLRIGDSDKYQYYVQSDLATRVVQDRSSGTQRSVVISYPSDQAYANVFISSTDTSSTSETPSLGGVLVTDREVSSVGNKNLVVVGGSCINTVAASLVGGAYCGSAWTSATAVGSGQYLVQSFSRSGGKIALLVAGYNKPARNIRHSSWKQVYRNCWKWWSFNCQKS